MPPLDLTPRAREFRQCQNCHKSENVPGVRLLSCKQCSRSHYCNRDCQVADWPKHKATCVSNANMLGRIKEKVDAKEIESNLKKWIQVHRPLLNITIVNALTLQTTPKRCFEEVLIVVLNPIFTKKSSKTPAKAFTVDKAEVAPLSEAKANIVEQMGQGQEEIFVPILAQSQGIYDKGGIGIGIMLILVPKGGIVHITPFGMPERLTEADVRPNKQWEMDLKEMVKRGTVV